MEALREHLLSRFLIDAEAGTVTRKADGVECTTPDTHGYTQVCCGKFNGKRKMMKRHQIIFLTVHGYLPDYTKHLTIDHRDRDKKNDRISNLREASQQAQLRNIGCKGVTRRGKYYRARIRGNDRKQIETTFKTYEEARAWRLEKEAELWTDSNQQT